MRMRPHPLASMLLPLLLIPAFLAPGQELEVVGGTSLDFGTMYRGSVVEHQVTIRNSGQDTLLINKVDASCGCTGTVVSDDRIGAGKTGTILITFNTRNFTGPIHKTVTVVSNARANGHAVIEFSGTVVDEVLRTPDQLWFQDAVVGEPSKATITIKNGGKEPLLLKGTRTDLEGFKMSVPDHPIAPGASATLEAVYTPAKSNPVLINGVFVATSNPRQSEIYIPIYGNIKGAKR